MQATDDERRQRDKEVSDHALRVLPLAGKTGGGGREGGYGGSGDALPVTFAAELFPAVRPIRLRFEADFAPR